MNKRVRIIRDPENFTMIELLVVIAIISILASTPVGSTIVAMDIAMFGCSYLAGQIMSKG